MTKTHTLALLFAITLFIFLGLIKVFVPEEEIFLS